MTEAAGPQVDPAPQASGASAGAQLRAAREAAGMHIAALAVALKVPVAKLEALESDRFEALPDAVFTRALAASVCKALKIDPAPVLQRLPGHVAAVLVPDRLRSHGAFREPGEQWRLPLLERLSRPVVTVVAVLLLGVLLLLFWPDRVPAPSENPAAGSGAPVVANAVPGTAVTATTAATPSSTSQAGPGVPASAVPAAAPAAPSAPPSVPAAVAPATAPSAAQLAAAPVAAPPGTGPLELRARAASWVEVTDASGGLALRRILAAGESVAVGGALPLSVVIGKADATEVLVRGRALDLGPLTRDNVARFQVK